MEGASVSFKGAIAWSWNFFLKISISKIVHTFQHRHWQLLTVLADVLFYFIHAAPWRVQSQARVDIFNEGAHFVLTSAGDHSISAATMTIAWLSLCNYHDRDDRPVNRGRAKVMFMTLSERQGYFLIDRMTLTRLTHPVEVDPQCRVDAIFVAAYWSVRV